MQLRHSIHTSGRAARECCSAQRLIIQYRACLVCKGSLHTSELATTVHIDDSMLHRLVKMSILLTSMAPTV